MQINKKKAITLKNRTKYFDKSKDKVRVTFGSPYSYQSREIKIEGYESRLYWHFRYCQDIDGATFFVTLTYNDANIPIHYGMNCFDYEDLRDLFTGGFRKQLLRKYGSTFKYFVGAELGDGKGKRGLHNNPHYHVLFFVEDAKNELFPYVKISDKEFLHLIRVYWQGFDQETDGFKSYKSARYGIVHEGKYGIRVKDYRACQYCAKYVCKDLALKQNEEKVERSIRWALRDDKEFLKDCYDKFYHTVVYDKYNTPLNSKKTKWLYDDISLLHHLYPEFEDASKDIYGSLEFASFIPDYHVPKLCKRLNLWNDFHSFKLDLMDLKVSEAITEYRNRFCNKCRISHGVGDYALKQIDDKKNPTIPIPSKDGFKNRPLSVYYYRKLFTDVIIPIKSCLNHHKPERLSPIRILNDDGIDYKVSKLRFQLARKAEQAKNNLSLIVGDDVLFDKMKNSDVNTEVFMSHCQFIQLLNSLSNEKVDFFYRYAVYKLVYENRFFSSHNLESIRDSGFHFIDVFGDYKRFLTPSFYSVSRSDVMLDFFLESGFEGCLPYSEHPYFHRFCRLFDVFDLCSDYFFVQGDNQRQKEAEDRQATRRFHDKRELKEFYSNFL